MDSPQPSSDPLLGRVLDGRYQIHGLIGAGGMGTVYRATHVLMGKPCAVKVLRGAAASSELAGKRFQREARSASRLDHEHCIRVSDFGITEDGLMYLVMELLDGASLSAELAAQGALPVPRVVAIATQIAEALAHAHALGLVHRDLKPDNIFLVTKSGTHDFVKVLDFGLAKLVDRGRAGLAGTLSTLSEVGTVFGTPEYMSPEQAEAKELDERSDIYSFGCLLYQMMTGQLPFQASSFVAILTKQLTEPPVPPDQRRPDLGLPAGLVELCLRCLEKNPRRRPASAAAIVDALSGLESTRRVPAKVAALPTMEIEPVARPRRIWPLFLGGLLAGGAAVALFAAQMGEAEAPAPPATGAAPVPAPAPVAAPAPAPAPAATTPPAATSPSPPAIAPASTTGYLKEAGRWRAAGNHLKELYFLQQAIRVEPGNREANYRLGAALLQDGQRELGCARLERAGALGKSLYDTEGCGALTGR